MKKHRRKPNWNTGMTRAQKAIADLISADQIAAFDRERAAGAFGAPGCVWRIGADHLATHNGPDLRVIAAAITAPGSNVVYIKSTNSPRLKKFAR